MAIFFSGWTAQSREPEEKAINHRARVIKTGTHDGGILLSEESEEEEREEEHEEEQEEDQQERENEEDQEKEGADESAEEERDEDRREQDEEEREQKEDSGKQPRSVKVKTKGKNPPKKQNR